MEGKAVFAGNVRRKGVKHRRGHLAGDKAVVNEAVEAELVAGQGGFDGLGAARDVRGADGLVSVLRGLAALVDVGLGGQEGLAVGALDHFAHRGERFIGDAGGVRADIGHKALQAFPCQFHALVELLGDLHGLAGVEVELARGLLLQVGGGERRGGHFAALALFDGAHAVRPLAGAREQRVALLAGVYVHFFAVFAVKARGQLRAVDHEASGDVVIFLGQEGVDLIFAVADHLRRHGLHAAGGEALFYLRPEDGADLVAHQAVEHAPRLLGVDAVDVNAARVLDGGLDGLHRHFVELDAAGGMLVDAQHIGQMPGNGLALAVRVGGEIDLRGRARLLADAVEDVAASADGDVLRLEVVLRGNADLRFGKVAHMSLRGFHLIATAEEFGDGLRLGRGFHDHQFRCHSCLHEKPTIDMPGRCHLALLRLCPEVRGLSRAN